MEDTLSFPKSSPGFASFPSSMVHFVSQFNLWYLQFQRFCSWIGPVPFLLWPPEATTPKGWMKGRFHRIPGLEKSSEASSPGFG